MNYCEAENRWYRSRNARRNGFITLSMGVTLVRSGGSYDIRLEGDTVVKIHYMNRHTVYFPEMLPGINTAQMTKYAKKLARMVSKYSPVQCRFDGRCFSYLDSRGNWLYFCSNTTTFSATGEVISAQHDFTPLLPPRKIHKTPGNRDGEKAWQDIVAGEDDEIVVRIKKVITVAEQVVNHQEDDSSPYDYGPEPEDDDNVYGFDVQVPDNNESVVNW